MSEDKFWRTTPRKLLLIWKQHCDFNSDNQNESEVKEAYIDQILPL